jgi:hypothetical protein
VFGDACYQQAELSRLRRDFAAAEEAYRRASEKGREPQPWPCAAQARAGSDRRCAQRVTAVARHDANQRAFSAVAQRKPLLRDREVCEIGDAERGLQPRDLGDVALERVLAEYLVLSLLELFTQLAVPRTADHLAECREENRVLAGRVRAVHPGEGSQGLSELGRRRSLRSAQDVIRNFTAALVLTKEDRDETDLAVRALKPGEDELLLELLVIVLDEATDDTRSARDDAKVELSVAFDATRGFVIEEHDALEHTVLVHQILAGRDLRLGLATGAGYRDDARARAGSEKVPPLQPPRFHHG